MLLAVPSAPPAPPVSPEVVIQAGDMTARDLEAMQHASDIVASAVPIVVMAGLVFVALIWLTLHYVTKWRQAKTLTTEDETLLDDLYDTARRLDDRLMTIERIVAADRLTERK